jgi:osmotically inducible protein OsmC
MRIAAKSHGIGRGGFMKRSATAQWQGAFKNGKGTLSTESGALSETPYSFHARFENQKGSNPEELIAAAHAGCFSMALSNELQQLELTPDWIETKASVSLEQGVQGWSISTVHLEVSARVPGASVEKFERAAQTAKMGCPVSKLLKAEITMETRLDQAGVNRDAELNF